MVLNILKNFSLNRFAPICVLYRRKLFHILLTFAPSFPGYVGKPENARKP